MQHRETKRACCFGNGSGQKLVVDRAARDDQSRGSYAIPPTLRHFAGDATGDGRTNGPYTRSGTIALALPMGLARLRTRMTVTVSLSEVPDVAMLATSMAAGKYTRGSESTDREAPAAKIVRHSKRFSNLGRAERQ
ncbi:hypothetical protein HN011_003895 [Eciton burchellii]|nr:hypothetical protein HN011_003895 [Eciton burchellii]